MSAFDIMQEFCETSIMRRSFSEILGLLLLTMPATARAQFDYITNADNTLTITGYYGTNANVTIPSAINGLPVTMLDGGSFYELFNISNVIITYGIKSIGDEAFRDDTNLTTITIADSVTNISSGAFWDSGLTNVFIPGSVQDVGDAAFYECGQLASVTISNGVANLERDAFYGCSMLSRASIPASVTNVGPYAFLNCTNLEEILVDPQNPYYSDQDGVLFDKSQANLLQFPEKRNGSYVIPPEVSVIQPFTFAYSVNLTNVAIATNITSIPDSCFFECAGLVDILIPTSITNIGGSSFENCSHLVTFIMPDSVTTIGPYAFAYCDDLTNIILSHSLMLIDDGTFYACSNLPSIVIPAAVTSIGTGAFFECTDLINVFFTGDAPILADAVFGYDTNATAYYIDGSTGWSEFTESSGIPAVLWNPVIQTNDGNFGVQNGQFGFAVTGTADIPVVIEACTNLTSPIWIPLRSLKLTNGLFYFSEPFQPNSVPRFYRISSP